MSGEARQTAELVEAIAIAVQAAESCSGTGDVRVHLEAAWKAAQAADFKASVDANFRTLFGAVNALQKEADPDFHSACFEFEGGQRISLKGKREDLQLLNKKLAVPGFVPERACRSSHARLERRLKEAKRALSEYVDDVDEGRRDPCPDTRQAIDHEIVASREALRVLNMTLPD